MRKRSSPKQPTEKDRNEKTGKVYRKKYKGSSDKNWKKGEGATETGNNLTRHKPVTTSHIPTTVSLGGSKGR